MDKLYTRQSLHTTTQLLQSSSGATAKIWSNYTQHKAYILQHSYSKAPVELETKFGQIIHKIKPTYYNTATPKLQWSYSQNLVKLYTRQSLHTTTQLLQGSSGATAKIWSNYTQDKAYVLQQKPTYYNTATPKLQWSYSQNLVKLYTRQSLHTTTQLLQGSSGATAKIWSNYTQDKAYVLQQKPTYYNTATPKLQWSYSQNLVKLYTRQSLHTTTQLLQGSSGATAKIWSNYTQDKAYVLQHSYLVKLYTRQSLRTTTQLLQGCSKARAKIWSNYTKGKAYILQHSYSKAPVELEPKFGEIIHKTNPTYYNTATPKLQWSYSQNLVKLYTRQSLHTTTQLLQGSSRTRAKIWSNYTQDKAYILQHSYFNAPVELQLKFGQIIHKTKAYILQHSYSKAPVELEPKFGEIIHKTNPTYYNTATPKLQWSYSQNLVKLYTRQSLHTTTQLLQGSSRTRAKIWSNYTQDKAYILQHSYFNAPVELQLKFGQIIHKTKAYILQHSYSKAPVELEPKFGEIIHKTNPTYYNTATPKLQWSYSQNLVKLYTRQSLHTTTQLLQGSSRTRAKIWSNYTQDKAYILQHSYSNAPVELQLKFGQIIHKTKPTYYNTATPRLQWSYRQNLVKLYTTQSLRTTTQLLQGCSRTRAKILSSYTQDKANILQHSYSKAPVELQPKFGQIIHKTKPTYYNTANPTLE